MDFLYLIFYACLRLQFLDVETNPGPRRPVPAVCRILCINVWGMAGNLRDLTVASSQIDTILLCSETLVSDMRHVSEILVAGFGRPLLLCRGKLYGGNVSSVPGKSVIITEVTSMGSALCRHSQISFSSEECSYLLSLLGANVQGQ